MNTFLQIKNIYETISFKKRERFETILEPLQAILQLALLPYCPIGTKLSIHQNILKIQLPNINQGILRWYQNDTKDDLFYLFHVCKRFTMFYTHLKNIKDYSKSSSNNNKKHTTQQKNETNLYDILIENAMKGVNKLIETYSGSDRISLLHTLQMYKMLLENSELFKDFKQPTIQTVKEEEIHNNETVKKDIDSIFLEIKNIYSLNEYNFCLYFFKSIQDKNISQSDVLDKIEGFNLFFKSKETIIKTWINDTIVF